MRRKIILAIFLMAAFAVHAAEKKQREPQILVIKDENAFEEHFKSQVLSKQMAPQILSKTATSLEQALPLIKAEAKMLAPVVVMTEYKGWFLFSSGEESFQPEKIGFDPIRIFIKGYAVKKGTAKLVLFGYCW